MMIDHQSTAPFRKLPGSVSVCTVLVARSRQWGFGLLGAIGTLLLSGSSGLAQQSTELPPPPLVVFPETNSDPAATPPTNSGSALPPPNLPPLNPELGPALEQEAGFPGGANLPSARSDRYLVYVNGNSPYLLQQVRMVAPNAAIQDHQGRSVIQVGRFADEAIARQQIAALNAWGIRAELMTDAGSGLAGLPGQGVSSPYVVVIPADRAALPGVAEQAMQLGIQPEAIQQREAPLGPHVAVGPYADRPQAEAVSRYLREHGLDARVVYRR